jgi:hypothetical protein
MRRMFREEESLQVMLGGLTGIRNFFAVPPK